MEALLEHVHTAQDVVMEVTVVMTLLRQVLRVPQADPRVQPMVSLRQLCLVHQVSYHQSPLSHRPPSEALNLVYPIAASKHSRMVLLIFSVVARTTKPFIRQEL